MRNTFEKRLKERLSKEFQRFDKFIQIQMGTAEKTDCAREAFLEFRRRTHRADIASLPTMRRWFGIGTFHKPTREHVIHMCFALGLSEEQAQEYLKKGLSEPGFQVNNYQELIFLYGIVNHYTYEECLSMMRQFEQNFDREFTYSNHAATQQINQKFEQVKLYPRDEFLLWMADHADWFKGYSRTTLDYLIQYRKIILTAARKEQEERLYCMLEEIGFYQWLAKHPAQSESRESIRYYLRRKNTKGYHISEHMKENVLELVQVVYQEKDTNISIIREIYEVAKNKQGGQPRHYGKTGQIRRVSNKYLSDLFSIPFQRERAGWVLSAVRNLERIPAEMACPPEINEKAEQYFHLMRPFSTVGEALERLYHEKKEQKRRCIVIQRSDLLPLILHAAQFCYRMETMDKRYDAKEAKTYFEQFANAALTACNMAPIDRTYELDTALLTCFQPEEMYGYPDVLEVLGKV